ncbi:hypothetical protein EI77_02177 [Prosthecobacter fusiformis]|uniref:Membrane protein implicated in regulation of membrane protease activity n=1 Tax=Prosthecobacter fusiformis TaxID=48464 RepID=A0A4R7S072_9BACT|nr:NfeD family protein [Prosthecobacter fusiformis]TDU71059.1 hypothetical protein EI77_02177 [Prosthecobacter fusiformis]
MIELFQESLATHNLPLTALLGMVVLYWLLVMIGAFDFDLDLFDGGADTPDLSSPHSGGTLGGAMLSAGRFFGFAQVPIAIWGSFFVLFLWLFGLILNYRLNGAPGDRSLTTAALLLVPGCIGSLALTKLVTLPVGKFFGAMADADSESLIIQGQVGIVTTTSLDERYGQVQVAQGGAPALVNARLHTGPDSLQKGDRIRVLEASPDGSFYYVEPLPTNPLP